VFPILKFGTDSQVAETVARLHEEQPEPFPFAERIMKHANNLDSASVPNAAMRLRKILVAELPDFQPARCPLVHSLVIAEQWNAALEVINRPSGSNFLGGGGGYAAWMVQICENLGILDRFLKCPKSVLDRYEMADILAITTSIHARRYDRAVDLWAELASDGYWFSRGGVIQCPIPEEHEKSMHKAVERWLKENPEHPARPSVRCLKARLDKATEIEYESILHEACEQWPKSTMILSELCDFMAMRGKVNDILSISQRILELEPGDIIGLKHKAYALIGMNRTAEALQVLEDTIPRCTGSPGIVSSRT
jgi:hypothetical protein